MAPIAWKIGLGGMALQYETGHKFPSLALPDERERAVSIAELAEGQPLILSFFRGPW